MPISINVRGTNNQPSTVNVDATPDRCPICHVAVTPIDWTTGTFAGQFLERLLQCPNNECHRLFIARYRHDNVAYLFQSCVPAEIKSPVQTNTIKEISKDFCSIYDEAYRAENQNLKLVAGPGYRKALEFLIKDYVISQCPETEADKIASYKNDVEKMLLARCIATYVKSEQVKEIAKRATWLGNDETHYALAATDGPVLAELQRRTR
jgi:hypothetical protein